MVGKPGETRGGSQWEVCHQEEMSVLPSLLKCPVYF